MSDKKLADKLAHEYCRDLYGNPELDRNPFGRPRYDAGWHGFLAGRISAMTEDELDWDHALSIIETAKENHQQHVQQGKGQLPLEWLAGVGSLITMRELYDAGDRSPQLHAAMIAAQKTCDPGPVEVPNA